MSIKPEDRIQAIVEYDADKESLKFREWFLKQFEVQSSANCSLEEFAVYFLNSLRQHTEAHLKVSGGTDTPKCQTPVKSLKSNVTQDDSVATRLMFGSTQQDTSTPNQSLRNEPCQNSLADWASQSMPRLNTSVDHSVNSQKNLTSTPVRRNVSGNSRRLSTTPGSANKSATASFCLGDFLVLSTPTSHNRSHKKKTTPGSSTNLPQSGGQHQNEKPKKRVQPISISKKVESSVAGNNSVFAGESSFSYENNILKISHTEVEDRGQCAILAARKILKSNASEITKELGASSIATGALVSEALVATSTPSKHANSFAIEEAPLHLENLEGNKILQRLADVYVILIDTHLTTNFLNELSFLLNLLNASSSHTSQTTIDAAFRKLELQNTEKCSKSLKCLEDLSHAVYFALLCLNQQKQRLASLDGKTLKVVLSNERFPYFEEDIRSFLLEIYQKKQQMLSENPMHDTSICFETKPCNNVYFQHEQDSRQHFTSNQEFANFRAQRDLFCKCLKMWETNHLNPNWKFCVEVAPRIREIFQQSEHWVNMAHFAKLFVSQLLLSASSASSPEEIGLDVDLQKFSKLTQRLIAPSQFSVDYQFPRTQAFFRDFILKASSSAFTEQLKLELYHELISLNDSSFDHINITKAENEPENHNNSLIADLANEQLAVRPEILNSMLILAKFLGFTISLPFVNSISSSNVIPTAEEKKQIRLRTLTQPNFNWHQVVEEGLEQGKLLITIPWMVQYISMLDNITLQLEVHIKVLKILFALYWYLGNDRVTLLPTTSRFIITSCLGWLFDSQQFLVEQYYHFRSEWIGNANGLHPLLVYVKSKLEKYEEGHEHGTMSDELSLNPLLEALLPVACPFLGEFRVSIMPAKYAQTKYASRSGRYRHITTRVAELSPSPQPREDDNSVDSAAALHNPKATQHNLIQAFRQSQNSSTRQIINFCAERAYKCVIKDGQLKILLPAKSKADSRVNEIVSFEFRTVFMEIKAIYTAARQSALAKWNDTIPIMLDRRIKDSLDSLLSEDTPAILKKTYFMIIKKDAQLKISQWFYANMVKDNYFCVDLENMANKLCSANKTKQPSELRIIKDTPSVSELIDTLQYWLHCTSMRIDLFKDSKPIVDLMQTITESFENALPTILYRLISSNIIQLLQHIITANCAHLTAELIEAACQVWLHPSMRRALDLSNCSTANDSESPSTHSIYDGLVTVAFLQTLGCKPECYAKFGLLIKAMIEKQIISLNYTNQLFVNTFKYEWHPSQLNEISNMLRNIAQRTATTKSRVGGGYGDGGDDDFNAEEDDEKSNLFMDMLADLSRDVDFF